MVRLAAYGGVSCLLAGYVVLSAFRQRSNFYSAAVYLSKSNACMMILWNLGVFITILIGRALQSIFFGPLRLLEIERLHERAWYAVTESLLALTIFRDEFDTAFVVLFVSLLFLKVFHWLAGDRVEMMEQSTSIPRRFHVRMVTILWTLWLVDIGLIIFAADVIYTEGLTVMIMFASEYMIMLATLLGTTLKYAVNVYDMRSEVPWENKSVFNFYIDLACDFLKLSTYLCFFSLILTFYGLPLNILRDVYITARSFVLKVRDLSRYRQATRNMDERYPNASAEDLERLSDKTCIICREEMEAREAAAPQERGTGRQGPNDTPKKLPCGHVFHFHCLRSWLERQQSCPTCRAPVLSRGPAVQNPAQRPQNAGIVPHAHAHGPAGQHPPPPQPGQAAHAPQNTAAAPENSLLSPAVAAGAAATARPSPRAADGHRARRAGPDNPLVAFQTRPREGQQTQQNNLFEASAIPRLSERPPTPTPTPITNAAPTAPSAPTIGVTDAAEPLSSSRAPDSSGSGVPSRAEMEKERLARLGKPATSHIPARASEQTPQIKIDAAPPATSTAQPPLPDSQPGGPSCASSSPSRSQHTPIHALSSPFSSPQTSSNPLLSLTSAQPYDGRAGDGRSSATQSQQNHGSAGNPAQADLGVASPSLPQPKPRSLFAAVDPRIPRSPLLSAATSQPLAPSANATDDLPRLIPLFDQLHPSQPSFAARLVPGLSTSPYLQTILANLPPSSSSFTAPVIPAMSSFNNTSPAEPPAAAAAGSDSGIGGSSRRLPQNLTEGQLQSLATITRESLETRLQLLQNTQDTLQACMKEIQDAMRVMPAENVHNVLALAFEVNASSERTNDPEDGQASGPAAAE